MNKVLTITVPSYNVEKFLNQTLDSFIDERILEALEVLIVDDGSQDHTAQIGKIYEEKYPQTFRVISKENGGHGSTINRGIQEAKGRYFKVVDGDDWVDTEGLVELIQRLENCTADYIFTNYYEVNDVTKEEVPQTYPGIPVNQELPFSAIADRSRIAMHAIAIKTELLKEHEIRLDEHCFYVDVEYILYPIPYVETVEYFDMYVYKYRLAQATQSVSIQGYQKHMQNHIDVILHLLDYVEAYSSLEDADAEKISYMERRIGEMAYGQVDIFVSFPTGDKEIRQKFYEFDHYLKQKNPGLYEKVGTYSGMLRMLRKTDFKAYGLIVGLSKWKNR
jgi:glycosyltransferase involved in cell wall biosynthesis